MNKIALALTSVILASAAMIASAVSEQPAGSTEPTIGQMYVASVASSEGHDYNLERESCCGPQRE